MQEHVNDCREPWALSQALSTDGDLRIAALRISGRPLGWAIRVSCITIVLSLTAVLSKQAHAQNASTKPNVTKETRVKVEGIRLNYPEFKLGPATQECLDGKLIDPECDPEINAEVNSFLKERAVNERERAVDERQREVTNVNLAREHIGVVLGLVQLGLFAFDDRAPPKNADFVSQVMESQSTSTEVRSLFNDFLARKKRGEKLTSKADSQRLIGLANKHLESANLLKAQITKNETFKKQIAAMYLQAASSLEMATQILAQKTGH